jgi:hypothetical protein
MNFRVMAFLLLISSVLSACLPACSCLTFTAFSRRRAGDLCTPF